MRLWKFRLGWLCVVMGIVGAFAVPSGAITIQTVQFTSDGGAKPVWGQSLTINVGATVPDASIPAIVDLDFVGFRTGDASIGSVGRSSVYLHIYDDFTITAGGAVATVGNLLAVSANSLDLETAAPATDASWFFGTTLLAKDVEYFYVMAGDTVAATTADPSNLIYSDMEVGVANPHGGGQAFHQTGDLGSGPASEDLFFRVTSSTPIPEPGTFSLAALGLAWLAIGRRRQRANAIRRNTLALTSILLVASTSASAGQITSVSWFSGVASVAGTVVNAPVAPNNDDVSGPSPNTFFVLQKDYFAIGPVDLVFDVVNSGGTTEYAIIEGVLNNTGLDWNGYHVELGFGTGASFVKSTAGDGLDFDAPLFNSTIDFNPSPGIFPLYNAPTEDDLVASGGIQPDFTFAGNFVFHMDVPDGMSSFTLRQSPLAVPEPGTFALVSLGLAGLAGWRRQRIGC